MSKVMYLLVSVFVLLAVLLPGSVYAQGDTDIPILFVNTVGNSVGGKELPAVLLTPAGYENVKTVTAVAGFLKELENIKAYNVLILAYHSLNQDADLLQGLQVVAPDLADWVKIGGILITTAGRDSEEKPLVDLFGLKVSDPGTGTEAIVPVEPNSPFAKDIAGNQLDASASSDNTPTNGQIYDEPLPAWVEYVVTRSQAGKPTSVAGHFGAGVLWLGAGFEITNIGTGTDPEQSKFTGFKQLWENFLEWATSPVLAVEPASKLPSTWGAIRSTH